MSVEIKTDMRTNYGGYTPQAERVLKHFKSKIWMTPSVVGYAETKRFYAEIEDGGSINHECELAKGDIEQLTGENCDA